MFSNIKVFFIRLLVFDQKYQPLIPPVQKAPICFSAAETEEYWDWYMDHLDERCEYLRCLIAEDSRISLESLDYSMDSLLLVWKWFLSRAKVVRKKLPRPYEKVSIISQETGGKPVKKTLKYDEFFDIKTEMMIRDIGMYVGKMFVSNYPDRIRWNVVRKPKNYIHVNEPLLQGFVQRNEGAKINPFYPDFEPIHMTHVQAAGIFEGKARMDDMYNLCRMWSEWIPQE